MISNESRLVFHPAFAAVFDELATLVAKEKERHPESYHESPLAKLLAQVHRAIVKEIPAHPEHAEYYQGEGDGDGSRQWRRAILSGGYRLYFKHDKESNVIVYGWLSDEINLRKYRRSIEAYREKALLHENTDQP
ncbi:type II toxin-antitoxin system YhaV family toxin [Geomonas sp. Red32]|uniref:type II toxin-antitoxin system YhaV family toxin n=1 Tax=Geomonas sp. Red32 TaxID=2912856 RepID=UPI00202CBD7B|nr:type II toxin-antitoxin system YhaV family toxin [Geomonas sp. Red32]MCM0081533.1 type II toxin-antitoxin system YhaV family toxin [Geomonas sp. Red32]